MHVLLVPSWYSDSERPLAGVFFRDLALALARQGHQVGIAPVPRPRSLRALPGRVRRPADLAAELTRTDDDELATYRARHWNWAPARFAPGASRRLALRAGSALIDRYVRDRGRPDVLHAHGALLGGCLAVRVSARIGVPTVLTEHSSAVLAGPTDRAEVALLRDALLRADALVTVSRRLRESLALLAPGRSVEVLGNPVDGSFFAPPAAPPPAQPFRLCGVGFLRPVKGFDRLIDAFALAFPDGGARLVIAGDGPLRQALEARALALGVDDRIELAGMLARSEVRDLLCASHALALSSRRETFGVALIEAMACGLPVVATRCGGPDDIVEPRSGLLVPPDDTPALAGALARMRLSVSDYDPGAIRRRCLERFGEEVIAARYGEVYRKVAADHAARRL